MNNYITRFYDEEIWKEVELKSPFKERYELFISNYGNVKKNNLIKGNTTIVKQPLTEGYPSVNLTIILPISEEDKAYFEAIRENIKVLKLDISSMEKLAIISEKPDPVLFQKIIENDKLLKTIKTNYTKNYKKREQKRKRFYGSLTHRLVAQYFLPKPEDDKNLVAHLDYDKLNNHHSNLKWMTREENTIHQRNSPYVIKSKASVFEKPTRRTNTKLTVNQVMILKKRLNEQTPLSTLAKRYKVSETQLLRIKRGENWGKVPAAL
ncbi:HNH endonuclease [Flavobacterium sp.]|uniref:HNH endonuclease n=1 Tax=Flavobacterium sp. TaxID=239 RepID=UPI00286C0AD8|nr:HNH endonuclease [Flavobacterium sp.]